ncbi:uncharacterized protein ISCGN_030946 [Ixodes scapularis]
MSWSAFSVNVDDLFYSLRHDQLLSSLRSCIEFNGEVAFRDTSGVTLEGFLKLLGFYFSSMVVGWRNKFFLQNTGVCISSTVAPILSDIFLSVVDSAIDVALRDSNVKKVFRYVDNFLMVFDKVDGEATQAN